MVLPPPLRTREGVPLCVLYQHLFIAACDLLPLLASNTKEKTRWMAVLRAFETLTFPTSFLDCGQSSVNLDRITYSWQWKNQD